MHLPVYRPKNSLGTYPVSDSLRLHVTGERPADLQGQPEAGEEGIAFEGEGDDDFGSNKRPGSKPDDMGNSRGKRMAMKFVNKIASKEKYTQVRVLSTSNWPLYLYASSEQLIGGSHLAASCHNNR